MRIKLASTPLAQWLAAAMGKWTDPDNGMPGISQHKLHQLAEVSQAQLHEVLKQGHVPKPDFLNRLAVFFEVDPLHLYRLAYLPDHTGDGPEMDLGSLRCILAQVPSDAREYFLDTLVAQAELLLHALRDARQQPRG